MSHVSPEEVRHVADLARIALSDEEMAVFAPQLERILDYIEQLRQVPTDNVDPTSHVVPLSNVLREDDVGACLPMETVVALAPVRQGPFVKVPRIIE